MVEKENKVITNEDDKTAHEETSRVLWMPIGMCIGLSIGMSLGMLFDSTSVGMCLGIAVGLAVGSAIDAMKRKDNVSDEGDDERNG